MTRPAHADPARTRAAIFASALKAFSVKGKDGATIREIAAGAKVTFATVHHYFGTKDELYEACLDEVFAHQVAIGAQIAEAVAGARLRDAVAVGARIAFRAARASPDRSRFLLRAYLFEQGPALRNKLIHARKSLLEEGARLLQAKTPEGSQIPLLALGILIGRFAVADATELKQLSNEVGDAEGALEEFVVRLARQSLTV